MLRVIVVINWWFVLGVVVGIDYVKLIGIDGKFFIFYYNYIYL